MGIILIITIFFSVVLLTVSMFEILNKSAEEYQKKYLSKASNDFETMFIYITPSQLFFLNIALTGFIFVLSFMIFEGWTFRIIFSAVGFWFPSFLMKKFKAKRLEKFNRQLVDSLVQMANAFKAGLSFPQAMENIAQESEAPLALEFELALKEMKLGVPVEEALISMAKRVQSEDLDLTVISTNIARQMGGNMSEMYDTISTTIRERFRLEGKIRSLTSQGKLQGIIVALLPLGLGIVLAQMRPDLMEPFLDSWFGTILIVAIMIMEVLGGFVIKKIITIDV
ncbi:type II secretion system F family protein [bacterium]|nr:type II secretion system F family protein [bacterium]